MSFKEISPYEIADNPSKLIGRDWLLITAGTEESCNTMTASWGQMGFQWNRPVATVYIRPGRYTREFVEQQDRFSLCFFENSRETRAALNLLGSVSGRDSNKIADAGLTTVMIDGVPAFEQARLVLVCRKLFCQDMQADSFVDKSIIDTHYPEADFHRIYIGEIQHVYSKE